MMRIDFLYNCRGYLTLESPSDTAYDDYVTVQECLEAIEGLSEVVDAAMGRLIEEADTESIVRLCHTGV
jgi:hypothetical protein